MTVDGEELEDLSAYEGQSRVEAQYDSVYFVWELGEERTYEYYMLEVQ